jgi:hypothetical protein
VPTPPLKGSFLPARNAIQDPGQRWCLNFGSRINRKSTVKKFSQKKKPNMPEKSKIKFQVMSKTSEENFRIRESNPLLSLLDIDFP